MDSQYALLIVVGIAIIAYILYTFPNRVSTSESFAVGVGAGEYTDTIYEKSAKTVFPAEFANNIIPVFGDTQANLFPVHILKIVDGTYLAVFNDGQIYYKDIITNKFWSGPLKSSMPADTHPLRMITLTSDGTLLGVAYDNKLYKKAKPTSATVKGYKMYETAWQLVPNCENIIYIMYKSADSGVANDILIGINTLGFLVRKSYAAMIKEEFTPMTNDTFPVLKIYFDKYGYMLAIGADFRLYRKATVDWESSAFDTATGGNAALLHDIIYDTDGLLYGLVALPAMLSFEMQKQQQPYYLSAFVPLEFIDLTRVQNILTDFDIIKYKTGANLSNLISVSDPLLADNTIDVVDVLIKSENVGKLRKHCASMGRVNSQDYSTKNKINTTQKTIEELKLKLQNLNNAVDGHATAIDPTRTQVQ